MVMCAFPCKFAYGKPCSSCYKTKCFKTCPHFQKAQCSKLNKPPDVCNGCQQRKVCKLEQHLYEAKIAQNEYETTRSESWKGFDALLMMSHINSYTRKKPNNRYTD